MINFIDTATITGEMFEYYCSWCVDMSKYEHIINLVRNNARSDVDLGQCNVND